MKPSLGLSSGVSRDTISLDCCGDWATLRSRQPRKYATEYMKRPTKARRTRHSLATERGVELPGGGAHEFKASRHSYRSRHLNSDLPSSDRSNRSTTPWPR